MAEPFLQNDDVHAALQAHFGHAAFRRGQEEVVRSVLSGRNTVVVMPTGAGKSLCYQLPAVMLPGVTLVISPLIALMKDQVEQLCARGIRAAYINSTLSDTERADRQRRLRGREYRLVYVAPERFASPGFVEAVTEAGVDLLAIDEAHCISQWGHDFRPDYAQLGRVRKLLRPPRTVALTATATPDVRTDIARVLLMKDPQVFVAGFDRENLFLEVVPVAGDEDKRQACRALVDEGGAGLVYCSTRRAAETMHDALRKRRSTVVLYHAGMSDDERHRAQDAFMGAPDAVAVATNAFGMGIDKRDIRFVAHANIPKAVEAYYQEIGRAGRDGQPSHAVLLFNHADVFTQERLIQGSHPPDRVFMDVWDELCELESYARPISALAGRVDASEFEVSAALRLLERAGAISRAGRGGGAWTVTPKPKATSAHPHSQAARAVLTALMGRVQVGQELQITPALWGRDLGLDEEATRHALQLLERAGAVAVHRPFAGKSIAVLRQVPFEQLGLDLSRVRAAERQALQLLRRMTDYAYGKHCRRGFILRYFGERVGSEDCGRCDVCCGPKLARVEAPARAPYAAAPQGYSELAFEELRRWRRQLAQELEVPPYILFNDATLYALSAALPLNRAQFLSVKGTGEARWERFGPKVIEISTLARAAGHSPRPVPARPPKRRRRAP